MNKMARQIRPDRRGADSPTASPGHAALAKLTKEADAMHALLVLRADALMGCTEGSEEEEELSAITDAIEAYEAKRWPERQNSGRQGLSGGASNLREPHHGLAGGCRTGYWRTHALRHRDHRATAFRHGSRVCNRQAPDATGQRLGPRGRWVRRHSNPWDGADRRSSSGSPSPAPARLHSVQVIELTHKRGPVTTRSAQSGSFP